MGEEVGVILLDKPDLFKWLEILEKEREALTQNQGSSEDYFTIKIENLKISDTKHSFIVLIACLVEYIHQLGYKTKLVFDDYDFYKLIIDTIKLDQYYRFGNKNYIEAEDDTILNLWKIIKEESIEYVNNATSYLNREYFEDYDLTTLKIVLDELFCNVADHSRCEAIAFIYLEYSPDSKIISCAVCDFGLGIPKTLRNAYPGKYTTDVDALNDAIKLGITARSTVQNRGFGLDNILSNITTDDKLRIISNRASLTCCDSKDNINSIPLHFNFTGSLIYFEIHTDSFPLREFDEGDVTLEY
ncbi:anti-sigma regulatory factor (Ser/Thr protein kinase) [Dysgonomonas sp. PFB1-18]|uniref:hypothetical protein n=1 Tax=unclassified Dysgonomonas TaxID=2630389 RepID=UPI0024754362|nr:MULTISPECIES: hypothetical protein [unclassified Dysgonomonas]MDH6309331.1 anti-sigma regulatory factor (Ser/Thr protein kinase) [Dysgonomonas sp. PF1-14]MDH6339804.1 anti-sigma regulatory factor (Ser/Thr protein kinase) [Dysgonomonas sp. PF1-16]MDH6381452.1 anti-sigma regulatory factor (Ser/Thr protein kinase) [Dysgonomonas sp. PFB1-18]MDH6398667.1 anti-sigma regulatory factor (Ser/Thr protein kinase) [Dysgonomonas sp. PF1-23]